MCLRYSSKSTTSFLLLVLLATSFINVPYLRPLLLSCNISLKLPTTTSHPTPNVKSKAYGLKLSQILKKVKNLYNRFAFLILRLAGDIELNPGPVCVYKKTTELFRNNHGKLKFFHVNCHSIVSKKNRLKML